MITKIDDVGRLVIPKALRQAVGLSAGAVEVVAEGAAIRIAPLAGCGTLNKGGRLVIEGSATINDDDVRRLRLVDQK